VGSGNAGRLVRGHGAFRDDVHPNERGNWLMAGAVAREILALGN